MHQQHNLKDKVFDYQQKLEENPQHLTAYYNMGVILKKLGCLEQAVDAYKNQLNVNPLHEKSWNNIGTVLFKQERYSEAKKSFNKALEIDPTYVYALTNSAELALVEKDYPLCLQYVNEILKLVTDNTEEYILAPFIIWLTAADKSYQPVLDAIKNQDNEHAFNWNFESLELVIYTLCKSQQKIAESFIAYFNKDLSLSGLQERLKND
ncbi:MAG: tetratricopeptide repeat protein [Methylococcales bacterium]|nr:tetratricopeptide repeat protein [Methylococcales bacterium]